MPEVDPVYSVEDFFDNIAKYLSPEQVAFVRKAYELAAEAHMKQRRASGDQRGAACIQRGAPEQ